MIKPSLALSAPQTTLIIEDPPVVTSQGFNLSAFGCFWVFLHSRYGKPLSTLLLGRPPKTMLELVFSLNGTLRHADINQVLSHRAQEKINKYRAGYAALDVRRAFLPAVVSTSGRIHGDLLRLLYLLADNKTKRHFRDRHEAIDDDSEAYCWRRSGFFWRMRASLGLACAQATTLAAQVFGQGNPRSRAGRTSA